jgi:hypothetical protein
MSAQSENENFGEGTKLLACTGWISPLLLAALAQGGEQRQGF